LALGTLLEIIFGVADAVELGSNSVNPPRRIEGGLRLSRPLLGMMWLVVVVSSALLWRWRIPLWSAKPNWSIVVGMVWLLFSVLTLLLTPAGLSLRSTDQRSRTRPAP
jgi:hypothetical protein